VQNLNVTTGTETRPLFAPIADLAETGEAAYPASVGMVVGATYPGELEQIRASHPTLPILQPGVGAQGGDLEASVRAGLDRDGLGLIVSASRSITYTSKESNYASEARRAATQLLSAINAVRADQTSR
jgi:orotidine-5'-phosphate decarboxylase